MENSFVVGMCARVHPMKDHDNVVKAATIFAETVLEARFVLIGEGTADLGLGIGSDESPHQVSPDDSCVSACVGTSADSTQRWTLRP